MKRLSELQVGEKGILHEVEDSILEQQLLEMGVTPGQLIEVERKSPFSDPIAIAVSVQLGLETRPFVFAVAFASSASFITPIGYQTNLMVYGPGGYKFSDYIRVGLPLSIILFISAVIIIPKIWSF